MPGEMPGEMPREMPGVILSVFECVPYFFKYQHSRQEIKDKKLFFSDLFDFIFRRISSYSVPAIDCFCKILKQQP